MLIMQTVVLFETSGVWWASASFHHHHRCRIDLGGILGTYFFKFFPHLGPFLHRQGFHATANAASNGSHFCYLFCCRSSPGVRDVRPVVCIVGCVLLWWFLFPHRRRCRRWFSSSSAPSKKSTLFSYFNLLQIINFPESLASSLAHSKLWDKREVFLVDGCSTHFFRNFRRLIEQQSGRAPLTTYPATIAAKRWRSSAEFVSHKTRLAHSEISHQKHCFLSFLRGRLIHSLFSFRFFAFSQHTTEMIGK